MYSKRVEKVLSTKHIIVGDRVRLTKGGEALEGILMPRPDVGSSDTLILKLENGYNIGVSLGGDAVLEKLGSSHEHMRFPSVKLVDHPGLRTVSLLYTGGTIGSKVDYVTGGVYMLTKPDELIAEVPELESIANMDVQHLMSVASEDLSHIEWAAIAERVAESLNKGSAGAVITHGTDTMHYTSAALSFMLKNLTGPVVLTGAQRSSDRGSSDAFMNLICSMHIAAHSDVGEVGICMHGSSSDDYCSLIRGTKARKMHTSARDAFKPINNSPMAKVFPDGKIEYVSDYKTINKEKKIKVKAMTGFEPKVALLMAHPNSDPSVIEHYLKKEYKGIIIAGTGLGHIAVSTPHKAYNWLQAIKDAVASGVVVGMAPQCLFGRVNGMVYRNARILMDAGVVYCEDMMPEVAYVKLGFLLGNYDKKKAKEMLAQDIAGEITPRTQSNWLGE